jgi:hypothetical protein
LTRLIVLLAGLALIAAPPAAAVAKYDLALSLTPQVRVLSADPDARGRGVFRGKVAVANTRRATASSPAAELDLGGAPIDLELRGGTCERDYSSSSYCHSEVPTLAPGADARQYDFGAFYSARGAASGSLDAEVGFPCRTEEVTCVNNQASVTLPIVAGPDSRIRRASVLGFSGRARRGRLGARLASVEIAVLRLTRRVRAFKGLPAPWATGRKRCSWLRNKQARFKRVRARGRTCERAVWLRARGKRRWRFELKRRLPAGRYVLYSRARNRAGASEQSFNKRDRNRRSFRVR